MNFLKKLRYQQLPSLGLALGFCGIISCSEKGGDSSEVQADAVDVPEVISFNEHVRPILNKNCIACHGGVKAAAGVSYLFRDEAIVKGDSDEWAIKPGSPEESLMLKRIVDSEDPMPPADHGHMLSETEVAILSKWIEEGAEWEVHWAYRAPEKPEIPAIESMEGAGALENPIDRLVAERLQEEGLSFSPQQERRRLMRRMSLDLTGLLPEEGDYEKFADKPLSEFADQLLSRSSYGERWASMWMDLARYADTMGYEKDSHRDMWPYRDYLIKSFNQDKPYDQFIVEQLAGDQIPEGTMEQLVATAFHRNTQTNMEGGTDDEEFRIAAVIDRNNTTWEVFQGTTMGCVQCHSHPYDPFRHEDYFKSFAFFNNSEDADDADYPKVLVPNDQAKFPEAIELIKQIEALEQANRNTFTKLADKFDWEVIKPNEQSTTGTGKLILDTKTNAIQSEGTIPWSATYSVKFGAPVNQLGALRLEALVPEGAAGKANDGFQLSFVELNMIHPDGRTEPIEFQTVFADYFRSDTDPRQVLANSGGGWTVFPHIIKDRELVLVPKTSVAIPEGATFEMKLHHKRYHETNRASLKRFRLSISEKDDWMKLAASEEQKQAVAKVNQSKSKLNSLGGPRLPVMMERPDRERRDTHVFVRGNWMTSGEKVEPGTPESLPEFDGTTRLDLAKWIASEENPLTARVIVNRLWFELFGRGLVNTLGDFGTQGDQPTHPELLDYLAIRLMKDHEWKLKPLLRDIVLSATYQQTSQCSPELRERDPYNQLLARGPRTRLTAEMVRDQALQAADLLSRKSLGPSVMPYQPNGVWQTVYSGAKWVTSKGEDKHRRALYTYWRRTSPYPSMITFDAPSREVCAIQRIDTNTPLQALVRLNDPVYFEAAQRFGQQMVADGKPPRDSIRAVYFELTAQEPTAATLDELVALYEKSLASYQGDPASSAKVGANPEEAAMTIVANILLNLDETLTK